MMLRVLLYLAILLTTSVCIAEEQKTRLRADQVPTFRIGALTCLTGKCASWGSVTGNGIQLAVSELNSEGHFVVEVLFEDTQGQNAQAVTAAKRLIETEGVSIIIGPLRSGETMAIAPITEAANVILFVPIASSSRITEAGDFVFRNRETSPQHAIRAADLFSELGVKTVAVIAAEAENSQSYLKPFEARARRLGITIAAQSDYHEETRDFRTELTSAKGKGAKGLYLSPTTGVDGGLIVKQAREVNFPGPIIANVTVETPEFLDAAGPSSEQVLYTSPEFETEKGPGGEFTKAYRNRFGMDPDVFAANAYDAAKLIGLGLAHCKSAIATCLRDYLYSVQDYPGAGGKISFDKFGDAAKTVMVKTVKNGKFAAASAEALN